MALHGLVFACWSSFWPREAMKGRLEPWCGFCAYRIFYNIGTIYLFGATFAFLERHSHETLQLWQLRHHAWFLPLIYALECGGVFFLAGVVQLGLSFWGLRTPAPDAGLQTGGFYKITRHPLYWSVFCLLFGHMLILGSSLAVLWFVVLEAYNVVGVVLFENPALAARYGTPFARFQARVSTVPFLSLWRGTVRFAPHEFPLGAVLGSLVFTTLVVWLHPRVFIPMMRHWPDLGQLFRP